MFFKMIENDSPPSEDIYGDLDSSFATKNVSLGYESDSSDCSNHTSVPTEAWMDEHDLEVLPPEPEKDIPTSCIHPVLNDAKLKKDEMDIYLELFIDEMANKKSKLMSDPEYKEMYNELIKIKAQLSEKEAEVSNLTLQNVNLKKNICSLFKTAKAEIEQKDLLLAEANEQVNTYRSKQYFRVGFTNKSTQTDLKKDTTTTLNDQANSKNCPTKPREVCGKRQTKTDCAENEQVQKKRKLEEGNSAESEKTISKDSSLEIRKDLNDLDSKFLLLPEEMKSSFKEHEQSYISSLIKLKQSLINCFLNQSKDQSLDKSASSSTESNFKIPLIVKSSETNVMPNNSKNSCIPKDSPLPPEKINLTSSADKNSSAVERVQTSKGSHSGQGNERSPIVKNSHVKRTDSVHDKYVQSDRNDYSSPSLSSKRDGMYQSNRSRHYYRPRESSVSRTGTSNYYEHRRRSLYKYSRDRYPSRPPCSPVGKNTSASLTLYKLRKERALKMQLNLSQKKSDENNK